MPGIAPEAAIAGMRILYFPPRKCWPVNAGARLRDYQLARQLARRASVTYFGLFDPGEKAHEPENDGLAPPEAIFARSLAFPKAPAYGLWNLLRPCRTHAGDGTELHQPIGLRRAGRSGKGDELRRRPGRGNPSGTVHSRPAHFPRVPASGLRLRTTSSASP